MSGSDSDDYVIPPKKKKRGGGYILGLSDDDGDDGDDDDNDFIDNRPEPKATSAEAKEAEALEEEVIENQLSALKDFSGDESDLLDEYADSLRQRGLKIDLSGDEDDQPTPGQRDEGDRPVPDENDQSVPVPDSENKTPEKSSQNGSVVRNVTPQKRPDFTPELPEELFFLTQKKCARNSTNDTWIFATKRGVISLNDIRDRFTEERLISSGVIGMHVATFNPSVDFIGVVKFEKPVTCAGFTNRLFHGGATSWPLAVFYFYKSPKKLVPLKKYWQIWGDKNRHGEECFSYGDDSFIAGLEETEKLKFGVLKFEEFALHQEITDPDELVWVYRYMGVHGPCKSTGSNYLTASQRRSQFPNLDPEEPIEKCGCGCKQLYDVHFSNYENAKAFAAGANKGKIAKDACSMVNYNVHKKMKSKPNYEFISEWFLYFEPEESLNTERLIHNIKRYCLGMCGPVPRIVRAMQSSTGFELTEAMKSVYKVFSFLCADDNRMWRERAIVLYGDTKCGKSFFLNVIRSMFPEQAIGNVTMTNAANTTNLDWFVAEACNKRVAIMDDCGIDGWKYILQNMRNHFDGTSVSNNKKYSKIQNTVKFPRCIITTNLSKAQILENFYGDQKKEMIISMNRFPAHNWLKFYPIDLDGLHADHLPTHQKAIDFFIWSLWEKMMTNAFAKSLIGDPDECSNFFRIVGSTPIDNIHAFLLNENDYAICKPSDLTRDRESLLLNQCQSIACGFNFSLSSYYKSIQRADAVDYWPQTVLDFVVEQIQYWTMDAQKVVDEFPDFRDMVEGDLDDLELKRKFQIAMTNVRILRESLVGGGVDLELVGERLHVKHK
ncbi:TPA_asm: E1 [Manila clam xenomavirus]|nr:TPA_asm: E1 [Manila clam xenomavirus]